MVSNAYCCGGYAILLLSGNPFGLPFVCLFTTYSLAMPRLIAISEMAHLLCIVCCFNIDLYNVLIG